MMSYYVPRSYFALSALALGLSLGVSGCGSSHHDSDNSGSLDLGTLSSGEVATIALGYYPGTDKSGDAFIDLSSKDGGPAVELGKSLTQKREVEERYGTAELEEASREIWDNYRAKCLSKGEAVASRGVNTTYTDMDEGDTTEVSCYLRYKKNITVQKMHANKDTSSTIILAQVVNGKPVITKEDALLYDEVFGVSNPYDTEGIGIATRVRNVFGSEWRKNGGKDGTDKVVLIFFSKDTIGSGTYGYTTSIDALSREDSSYSNEGEIVYLNASKKGLDLYSTMAHEFQHICNFNQKYITEGTFSSDGFEYTSINEGQSMLAEDLVGCGLAPKEDGTAVPGNYFMAKAINGYMEEPASVESHNFNNSAGDYGKSYLLMRYIADRFGVGCVSSIAKTKNTGFANLEAATKISLIDIFDGMTVASTALKSLPANFTFKNVRLDADYDLLSQDGSVETTYVSSIRGDEIYARDFGSGEVALSPNTSTVIDIIGDGSKVKLKYNLPEKCSGTVVISKNGAYSKKMTLK